LIWVGEGDGEGVSTYIAGEWALAYSVQSMPFNGVLLGLTMKTSGPLKKPLVQAPGIDNNRWEQTGKVETSGILTMQFTPGEPIHKIATRAIKFWKEFEDGFP
jgi:enoyl reductase-like protein